MILKFYGAAQEVGRSAIVLKLDKTFLLDYGIKLGTEIQIPVSEPKIDALLLSHAHLDHSGDVPALYKDQDFPAFATNPTFKLSDLLLKDSINIAKKNNTKSQFSKKNLSKFRMMQRHKKYRSEFEFGNSRISFHDAGHVCGSAITKIENSGKTIVYTGDFKLSHQLLHGGAEIVKSNVLITESTYARKNHPGRDELTKQFIEKIKETLDNGGTALIPAFAVGRGQDILAMLEKNNLTPRVFLAGMIKKASGIALNHKEFMHNPHLLEDAMAHVEFIDKKHQKRILDEPAIILTTAGMLNGGPVLKYIDKLPKNSHIFLTGYQVDGTNGRMLMDSGYIVDNGEKKRINTPYTFFDFSAHADKNDLLEYAKKSSPETVVCVHGDKENAVALADDLRGHGFDAYAPQLGETIKIE
ncbi:MAG: MBL fold metallo-hydrolase [Candidatus Marsarchaeota archaeon]|nr:MBL fold metallo-hydrolase [Candidatus Marsarchaeota archaeon]MCL5105997.1 MBL fold metallo-hydrolase [Candidatus Marsarchaeota archaeon]